MAGNVLFYGMAVQKGFEPRLYGYTAADIPAGEYVAVLDFKIWAKKILGISCYFTEQGTGRKFQLTVYCRHGKGVYKVGEGDLDFARSPTGCLYRVTISYHPNGRTVMFDSAVLI